MENGTCTGLGCCQTSIPKNVSRVDVSLRSDHKYRDVWNFSGCGYAFVVEKTAFTFYPQNISSLRHVENLPMVLDWTIGKRTCGEAMANSSAYAYAYACRSVNSVCYDADNGYGYRCNCTPGYQGNPYLHGGCQDINECQNSNDCEKHCVNTAGSFKCTCPKGYYGDGTKSGKGCIHKVSLIFRLVSEISIGIIVLLVSACWIYLLLQRRRLVKMRQRYFRQNGGILLQEKLRGKEGSSNTTISFSFTELKKATDTFHSSKIIGQGGYGTVYKGSLPDSRVVAIKKSKEVPKQVDQFTNEVIVLSQINHRNVVKLLGCCLETKVPLLVYEFVSNGTLYEHVHNKAKARHLSWDMRLKIAAETAGVLSYLHSEASTPIVHRDVKTSNILLDHNLTAKVSDFGASRLFPLDHAELTTLVQGTFGYLDPEYMQMSQLTEKSVVYSFGVVLAELLTGRKAVCNDRPEEERSLANFFLSVVEREEVLFQVLEENIGVREGDKDVVMRVAALAKRCLNVRGDERPCMKEVEMELEAVRFGGGKHSSIHAEDEESVHGDDGFNSLTSFEGTSTTSMGFDSVKG